MTPLALGLPLSLPALPLAAQAAAGGLDFLRSLLPAAPSPPPPTRPADTANVAGLQRTISEALRRAGLGRCLPLEIANDSSGRLNVLSDNPNRSSIEQLLNSNPSIVQQFGALAQRAGGTLRTIISTATGFDATA